MSKRIALFFVVFLAVVLGGYYVVWQRQATYYKETAAKLLTQLPTALTQSGVTIEVAHPDLSVGGFPFRHTITLHHPDVTVRVMPHQLMEMVVKKTAELEIPGASDDIPIVYHYTSSGDFAFILHYFTAHVSADAKGESNFVMTRGGDTLSAKSEQPIEWHYDADFRKGAILPLLRSVMHNQPIEWKTIAPYLKSLSLDGEASRLLATDTKEPLSASGPISMMIDNIHLDESSPRLHLKMNVADSEVFDRFQRFIKAITTLQPVAKIELSPFESHDVVGKTNIDLDIGLASNGGNTARALGLPVQGQIDAKTLRFSNNLFQLSFPFFVEINTHDGLTGFKVQQPEASLAFSTAFDTALEQSLRKSFADKAMREQLAAQFGAADKADTLADYISDVLPKMSGFGTLKTAIDISGNVSDSMPPAINAGNLDMKKLRFSSDPYALNLAGSYDAPSKEGFLTLDCTHCPQLIADGVEYNNRVQRTLKALNPQRQAVIITPEFYDAIVTFLNGLNTSKDKDILTLSVKASGDGNVVVSGKPFGDVMMGAIQTFGPLLQSLTQEPDPATSEP